MHIELENLPEYSQFETIEKYKLLAKDPQSSNGDYTIFPDGYFDLAFLLSDSDCIVLLAGPYTKKVIVRLEGFEFFIVRFKVGSMPDLYDIKPLELVDTMIQIPKVFDIQSETLCEILLGKKSFAAKQKFIEVLLHGITFKPMMKDSVYSRSTAIIESCHGRIKVDELATTLNVSPRTLERRFKENLGLAPKQFIRLVRFNQTMEKLKKHDTKTTYADIAYESGYTDQAHFINDFKSLSGISPGCFK
jgi:AraC-like DNA-binding protein